MVDNRLELRIIPNSNRWLRECMREHYSRPLGFVGRNICFAILYEKAYYGCIVAGSATRYLPGRNDALLINEKQLNCVVNNTFFHVEPHRRLGYPIRNFVPAVLAAWRSAVVELWPDRYGNPVFGFESLVELPRTGECYRRDGWIEVGMTKGYTCKRTAGQGTDSWSGKRVWDTENLRPKRVFVRLHIAP